PRRSPALRAAPPLWARVSRWLRQGTPLVPSERIFGPDAAGGYLAGGWPGGSRWMVVMPSDHRAPDPVRSGCLLPVRDCDGSLEPVPVLGPPECRGARRLMAAASDGRRALHAAARAAGAGCSGACGARAAWSRT